MRPRVVVPTYDERDTIVDLLAELRARLGPAARILVVDDGSPDGTAELVRAVVARDPAVELLSRPAKLGLASAYQVALRRVLDEGRDDCVVTLDADFSHHPRYVPALVEAAATHDLVVGSRYVAGGGIDNWGARRRLLSLAGNWYARTVTGTPVRDLTAGLTCMRTDFLRAVPFDRIQSRGYAWLIALKTLFHRHGARIHELPIHFVERRFGQSKLSTNIVYEGLVEPWRIRRALTTDTRPPRGPRG
ncbi:MAG TPA: polyprenol monophosphomannose synthase [Methylomirabilota bacterium]